MKKKQIKLFVITVLTFVISCSVVLIGKGKVNVKADEKD